MENHYLAPDIAGASITELVVDGPDLLYMHLDNGIILAFSAGAVKGSPYLHVTRVIPTALIH